MVKSLLLQFPPLHYLNEMVDEMSTTPKKKMLKRTQSPSNDATPRITAVSKIRSSSSVGGCASKSLKFSPHLFKTEPLTCEGRLYSPNGVLDRPANEKTCNSEQEDDIIDIDAL